MAKYVSYGEHQTELCCLTMKRRCRLDYLDIQPGQHGVGNRHVPARLDSTAQGVGTKNKGL